VLRLRHLHLPHLLLSWRGALRRVRREDPGGALRAAAPPVGVVGISAVTPLLADPTVRAEQVSQLVLGETAELLEAQGEWRRLRTALDGYEGWAHRGYLRELDPAALAAWRPGEWSEGALVEADGVPVHLPLRARVAVERGAVVLPDMRCGRLVSGRISTLAAAVADARAIPPHEWAARHFLGTPYQWGGVTPWGADCSGLVQTTFVARGAAVPRDAHDQAAHGAGVPPGHARPGDLLFFRSERSERITHVAFLASGSTIVHSTISCGGAVREPWEVGSPAWNRLADRFVAVRRFADPER
jgi:hypothetical protein